jgi:hypothetical protein
MSTGPDVSSTITMFNASTSTVNTMWQFFTTVALAVVTYAWKQAPEARGRAKLTLALGFAIFALANHFALARALEGLTAATRSAQQLAQLPEIHPTTRALLEALPQTCATGVRFFQVLLSCAVLLAIYFAHRRDRVTS